MNGNTLRRLILVLAAVLSLGSVAEAAAPTKTVHRRPKHSTRVASGATMKKKPTGTTKSRTTTVKKPAQPQRKPTTKPR